MHHPDMRAITAALCLALCLLSVAGADSSTEVTPDMFTVFGDHNYTYYYSTPSSFLVARSICMAAGGDLASFTDQDNYRVVVAALIKDTTPTAAPVWIGVSATSHADLSSLNPVYLDHSPSSFTFWGTAADGTPLAGPTSSEGECVAVSPTWRDPDTGMAVWDSYNCAVRNRFLCKTPLDALLPASPSPSLSPMVPATYPPTYPPPDFIPNFFGVRVLSQPANTHTCVALHLGILKALIQHDLQDRLVGKDPIQCVNLNDHVIVDVGLDSRASVAIFMTVLTNGGMGLVVRTAGPEGVPCNSTVNALPVSSLDSWTTFTCNGQSDTVFMSYNQALPELCCSEESSSEESSSEESSPEESSHEESSHEESSHEESSYEESSDYEYSAYEYSNYEISEESSSDYWYEESSGEESSDHEESSSEESSGPAPEEWSKVSIVIQTAAGCDAAVAVVNDVLTMSPGLSYPDGSQCTLPFEMVDNVDNFVNVTLYYAEYTAASALTQQLEQGLLAQQLATLLYAPCDSKVWVSTQPQTYLSSYLGIGCGTSATAATVPMSMDRVKGYAYYQPMCCDTAEPPDAPMPNQPPGIPAGTTYWAVQLGAASNCDPAAAIFRSYITELGFNSSLVEPQEDSGTEIYITQWVFCQQSADFLELGVLLSGADIAANLTSVVSTGAASTLAYRLHAPCSTDISILVTPYGQLGTLAPQVVLGCTAQQSSTQSSDSSYVVVPGLCCPSANSPAPASLLVVTSGGSCANSVRAAYNTIAKLELSGALRQTTMKSTSPPYSSITQTGEVICKASTSFQGETDQVVLKAGFDCWYSAQQVLNALQGDAAIMSSFMSELGPQCDSIMQVRVSNTLAPHTPEDTLFSCLGPASNDTYFLYDEEWEDGSQSALPPFPYWNSTKTPMPSPPTTGPTTSVVNVWAVSDMCCAPLAPPALPPSLPPLSPSSPLAPPTPPPPHPPLPAPPSFIMGSTLVLAIHFATPNNPDYACTAFNDTLNQGLSLLGLADDQMPLSVKCQELGSNNRLLFLTFPQASTAKAVVDALTSLPDVAGGLMAALQTSCGTSFWLAAYPGKMIMSVDVPTNATDPSISTTFLLPFATFNKLPNVVLTCQTTDETDAMVKLSATAVVTVPSLCCTSQSPPPSLAGSAIFIAASLPAASVQEPVCDTLVKTIQSGLAIFGLPEAQMPVSWDCGKQGPTSYTVVFNFDDPSTAKAVVSALTDSDDISGSTFFSMQVPCSTQFWLAAYPAKVSTGSQQQGIQTAITNSSRSSSISVSSSGPGLVTTTSDPGDGNLHTNFSRSFGLPFDFFSTLPNVLAGCGKDLNASSETAAIVRYSQAKLTRIPGLCCESHSPPPAVPSVLSPPPLAPGTRTCQRFLAYYQWFAFYANMPQSWVCTMSKGQWLQEPCGCPAAYVSKDGFMCCADKAPSNFTAQSQQPRAGKRHRMLLGHRY